MTSTMLTSEGEVVTGTVVAQSDLDYRNELMDAIRIYFPHAYESQRKKLATELVCRWEMKPRPEPFEQHYDGPREMPTPKPPDPEPVR